MELRCASQQEEEAGMNVARKNILLKLSDEEKKMVLAAVESCIELTTDDLRDRDWIDKEGRKEARQEQKALRRLCRALR